jgi:hypothetical protein
MLYRHQSETWSLIQQPDSAQAIQNLPLGVLEDSGYRGRRLIMQVGDIVVFYTDCLSEAAREAGQMLGVDGLMKTIAKLDRNTLTAPPPQMLDGLLASLDEGEYCLDDDMTMVVLRCTQRSEGMGIWESLKGVYRSTKTLFSKQPIPWPEVSWANLVGPIKRAWGR